MRGITLGLPSPHGKSPNGWNVRSGAALALGAALWISAGMVLVCAASTVHSRIGRASMELKISVDWEVRARPGDSVFLQRTDGMSRIGEVTQVSPNTGGTSGAQLQLALEPKAFEALRWGATARIWQTPLSAECAFAALLPRGVQARAAAHLAATWDSKEERLREAWTPVVTEWAHRLFWELLADIESAWRKREGEIAEILDAHAAELSQRWPMIQARVHPILNERLVPTLARLSAKALSAAPKAETAWLMASGKQSEAMEQFAAWLRGYLEQLPESDRQAFRTSLQETWIALRDDSVLQQERHALLQRVLDDDHLWRMLSDLYRESVAENPHTSAMLLRAFRSPEVQLRVFEFVEEFAPAAKDAAAAILFEQDGTTRPEATYLVRSAFLGRSLLWITLSPHEAHNGPILKPGDRLVAIPAGAQQ